MAPRTRGPRRTDGGSPRPHTRHQMWRALMPLAITQDHRELADVVRSFATGQALRAETRQYLEKPPQTPDTGVVWQQVGDLGWAGLHVPEEYGGSGYGLAELAVVLEGLGAVAASGPLLATAVAAAVVSQVGTPEQR